MKPSCLIAFAILLISLYFVFKFLYEVYLIGRNPKKYLKRFDSYKKGF